MHVANIDYAHFFEPAFPGRDACRAFVDCVENIPAASSKAKIVIHQAAPMLWLGDRMDEVARGRPALQLLFHLIAAEAVAKIVSNFQDDGQSRGHVRLFFEQICGQRHRDVLGAAFRRVPGGPALSIREAVDFLYDVRCDVVHEGVYFGLTLARPGDATQWLTPSGTGPLIPSVSIQDIRQIVLEGSVLGAVKLLPPGSPCAQLVI